MDLGGEHDLCVHGGLGKGAGGLGLMFGFYRLTDLGELNQSQQQEKSNFEYITHIAFSSLVRYSNSRE